MRLLVAEDEKDMNRLITRALEKEGYGVDSCFDGEEAMDYLESAEYDGVILDIMMPKMDGHQVLKKLRARGSDLPVLFLSHEFVTYYSFLLLYYAHPSVVSFQDSLCMIELEKEPFQHFYRDTVSCHSDNFITREQLASYSLFRIILLKFVIIFIGKSHK